VGKQAVKLKLFKRNFKYHRESAYKKHKSTKVGRYQAYPERPLKLIKASGLNPERSLIDIGGRNSMLSSQLLESKNST